MIELIKTNHFEKITENIYCYQDYVNVFVIKNEDSAILIDFGSGNVLNHLHEIGVDKVDYLFHTHYHRDQCSGDKSAIERNIKIAASRKEKKLFDQAETFWKTKSFYHLYNMKPTFFTSTYNIPLDLTFKSGDTFKWGSYKFQIVETSGHTLGSISYLLRIDNKILAFTGDLIHSQGKVITLYDLIYSHGVLGLEQGISNSIKSLKKLLKNSPSIFLPSHGDVIYSPKEDSFKLINEFNKIRSTCRLNTGIKGRISSTVSSLMSKFPNFFLKIIPENKEINRIFPHIKFKGFGTTYIILGKNKNCILIDFAGGGAPLWPFDLENLQVILRENNIETIDFLIPTHYHDDHVCGIPQLQKELDVKVYSLQNIADILENPTHYRLPCLFDQSIKVDKTFKEGEILEWDDYHFQFFHFPGQTEYHLGLFTEIDGKTIFFTGDSFKPNILNEQDISFSFYNLCKIGKNVGVMKCAETLLKCDPEYIASSHFGIFKVNRDILEKWLNLASTYEEVFSDVIAQENPNFGSDPQWVHFKPIKVTSKPGEQIETNLVVRNYLSKSSSLEFQLNLPEKWEADFKNNSVEIPPNSTKEIPITIKIPLTERQDRTVITADIFWNKKNLGPFPDLLVDHGYIPNNSWTGWSNEKGFSLLQWISYLFKMSEDFFR